MRQRRCTTRRGFTLVEVLATLVLVGIVLPVAMSGITLSLQTSARARHLSEAARLAESKLNEILVSRDTVYLNSQGDFGPHWPEYRWESRSQPRDFSMYETAVTVWWMERGRERSVTLATLVYPDGQAEPLE